MVCLCITSGGVGGDSPKPLFLLSASLASSEQTSHLIHFLGAGHPPPLRGRRVHCTAQRPFSEEDMGLEEEQTEVQGLRGTIQMAFGTREIGEPLPLVM